MKVLRSGWLIDFHWKNTKSARELSRADREQEAALSAPETCPLTVEPSSVTEETIFFCIYHEYNR